jgi:gamma-D-glutamyl-L-lysine dipeptidyl-peptidase
MKKIIKTPFTNIHDDARFASEIVTQGVMGEVAEVLDRQGDWVKLRLPDSYEGWAQNFSTVDIDKETEALFQQLPHIMIHTPFLPVYPSADFKGPRMAVTTMGTTFPYLKHCNENYEILLPDGRHGHIQQKTMGVTDPRDIILCAAGRLLGASYFWGGKTENGIDCSGLVQMCFRIAGLSLPRDASQQIKVLKKHPVDMEIAKPGDLAFFQNEKGNITHVAIMRKTPEYIHSSGEVKINTFDPNAPAYLKKLDDMLEGIYSIEHLLRG